MYCHTVVKWKEKGQININVSHDLYLRPNNKGGKKRGKFLNRHNDKP